MDNTLTVLLALTLYGVQYIGAQCPIPMVLEATSGTINSPTIPGDTSYPRYSQCIWVVDIPGDDYCEVTFTFTSFDLETDDDALFISDQFGTFEYYSGADIPDALTVYEPARLVFHADWGAKDDGFEIEYTVSNCNPSRAGFLTNDCWPIKMVTEPTGTITSINYPAFYAYTAPCVWIIDIPDAECIISVLLEDIDMAAVPDILAVGDKLGSMTLIDGKFDIEEQPYEQRTLIEPVIITFTSSAAADSKGFSLNYANITCVPDPCIMPAIDHKSGEYIDQATRTFKYTCDHGWQPSDAGFHDCGTTDALTCDPVCDVVPDVDDGETEALSGSTKYLTVCHQGFIIEDENTVFKYTDCTSGSPAPVCVCSLPTLLNGDAVRIDASFYEADCYDGFYSSPPGPIECNTITPSCKPILCPEINTLLAISNGDVDMYQEHAGFKLTCNRAYVSSITFNQVHEVDCLFHEIPKCVPEMCVKEPKIINGNVKDFEFAEGFTLTCNDGYVSSGNRLREQELTCDENDLPICGILGCMEQLQIDYGEVSHFTRGVSYRVTCDPDYVCTNTLSRVCNIICETDPMPVCIPAKCSAIPSIPNGQVTEFVHGVSFLLTCDPGYWASGSLASTQRLDCLKDKLPICVDVNECKEVGLCGKNADCRNTPGSFHCDCHTGYIWIVNKPLPDPKTTIREDTYCEISARGCDYLLAAGICGTNQCEISSQTGRPHCLCEEGDTNPFCSPSTISTTTLALSATGLALSVLAIVFVCLAMSVWRPHVVQPRLPVPPAFRPAKPFPPYAYRGLRGPRSMVLGSVS